MLSAYLYLSEIYANPPSGSNEFVEIYNSATTSANLSGYSLYDQLSSPSLIYTFSNIELAGGEYYVATLSASKLNNSGDGVELKDNIGQTIDQMSYSGSQVGKSWSLIDSVWQITDPTPGSVNPTPTPTPSPTPSPTPTITPTPTPSPSPSPINLSLLHLSEFVACPQTGENEWVELFSESPDDIELSGFILHDNTGKIFTYTDQVIGQNEYLVIDLSAARLNNSGDSLKLVSSGDETVFSVSYSSCNKGNSIVLVGNELKETKTPTKGKENEYEARRTEEEEEKVENSPSTAAGRQSTIKNNPDSILHNPSNPSSSILGMTVGKDFIQLTSYTPKLVVEKEEIHTPDSLIPASPAGRQNPKSKMQNNNQLVQSYSSVIMGGLVIFASNLFVMLKYARPA